MNNVEIWTTWFCATQEARGLTTDTKRRQRIDADHVRRMKWDGVDSGWGVARADDRGRKEKADHVERMRWGSIGWGCIRCGAFMLTTSAKKRRRRVYADQVDLTR